MSKVSIFQKVLFSALLLTASMFVSAIEPDANCDEWTTSSTILPAGTYTVTVTLWNESGSSPVEIESNTQSLTLAVDGPFLLSAPWSGVLPTADYKATYLVDVQPANSPWGYSIDLPSVTFSCTSRVVEARTPGYWKNHPEAWPVANLTLGDQTYAQSCLLTVLDEPTKGDVRVKLLHHLIAAKLNLLNGADASLIAATISSSDDYLENTGALGSDCSGSILVTSKPKGADKAIPEALKNALDAFNNNAM